MAGPRLVRRASGDEWQIYGKPVATEPEVVEPPAPQAEFVVEEEEEEEEEEEAIEENAPFLEADTAVTE